MGIFSKQTEAATKQWAQNLTLEQIEEYERKGMDITLYRQMREEFLADKQKLIDDSINSMDLGKLDKYKNARSAENAFVNDVAKLNGISDKKKQQLELAPLVYGRVVQANHTLYKPEKDKFGGGGGIVFLFALDDAHHYNEEWLAKTANRISEMKDKVNNFKVTGFLPTISKLLDLGNNIMISSILAKKQLECIPEDCREFIGTLRNDTSSFCFPLSKSLNEEGADAWCTTFVLDKPSKLPLSYIPYNRIIPFLLSEQPQKNRIANIQLIPPAYYTK